jgi:predicted permease
MDWLKELARRIRMLLHRKQTASELAEEMQLHLDLRRQQQVESGATPDDAAAAAHRRFGNPTLVRERSYTAWGWSWLESLLQDILYGLRAMLRSPGITIVALLSLALGIGASTAIFSLMDTVMLRSLPVKDPGKLLLLGPGDAWGITTSFGHTDLFSYPFYRQMRQHNQVFTDVAAFFSLPNDVHGSVDNGESEPMHVQLVSGTYFSTLGVHALRGRMFTDADDRVEGGNPVAVVSYSWWKGNLARDPNVLQKALKIGDISYSIVGVAPPEFFGTTVGQSPDIWIPLSMVQQVPPHYWGYTDNFAEGLEIFGRLKPGVTVAQATFDVNLLFQQILRGFAGGSPSQKDQETLKRAKVQLTSMAKGLSTLRAEFSDPLKILMAIVGLVLLIACANIANLLLARSTARAREFAVRQALGAQRTRLIRQLLTESLLLAFAGGALGAGIAAAANHLLLRMVSDTTDVVPLNVSIDTRMLLFTVAITLATALIFGTVPAFRATRLELTSALKDGKATTGSRTRSPLARSLIISQIAFSLVLVVGAGLFLRSLVNLNRVDTGFNKENVLRLDVDASSAGYKDDDPRLRTLYEQIEAEVSALPGVRAASFSAFTFNEIGWNGAIAVAGYHTPPNNNVKHNTVGNGYFATMQIPLLAGRTFGPQDTPTSQKVAVISEGMARTLFPAGSPIGRHYGIDDPKQADELEVIGVVKDARLGSLTDDASTWMVDYLPAAQRDGYLNDFEVRYTGEFATISPEVKRTIHSIAPHLPISNVTTLDEQIARSITDQRVVAHLSTFFGLLAVLLSAIGIYGLMSYVVSRRTNEIGIRMALGAERMHVRWLVMREILVLVAIGIAIGVPAALLSSRLVASMLFSLSATDAASLLAAVAVMLASAALAGYLPARRASRIDPMVALRHE